MAVNTNSLVTFNILGKVVRSTHRQARDRFNEPQNKRTSKKIK